MQRGRRSLLQTCRLKSNRSRAVVFGSTVTACGAGAGGVFDPNFGASFPGQATTGGAPVGTATQNVVAIGKRLSSRVILTYEQGLRGVWNLLRIQYDITNRLSIRAQTGTDSAVDVLYFWSFD